MRRLIRSISAGDGGTKPAARNRCRNRPQRATRLSTGAVRAGSGLSGLRQYERPSRVRIRTAPCRSHAANTLAGWRFKSRTVNDCAVAERAEGGFDFGVGFMSDVLTDLGPSVNRRRGTRLPRQRAPVAPGKPGCHPDSSHGSGSGRGTRRATHGADHGTNFDPRPDARDPGREARTRAAESAARARRPRWAPAAAAARRWLAGGPRPRFARR